jgi:hemerythrin
MPFIEWDISFAIGVQQFDEHHQHLMRLLNKAYDDFICAAPDENLGFILKELIDYAGYHFKAEEDLLLKNSYAKLNEHKGEHELFSQSILKFQNDFHCGKAFISLDVLTFLKKWLHTHILESDAEYGRFISQQESKVL